nr:MAG TPA: hypothetical protein [Caudoviricetes sp.]
MACFSLSAPLHWLSGHQVGYPTLSPSYLFRSPLSYSSKSLQVFQ